MSPKELDLFMSKLPETWRYNWCGGDPDSSGFHSFPCACLGCVNNSGEAVKAGITFRDWEEWKHWHPKPVLTGS